MKKSFFIRFVSFILTSAAGVLITASVFKYILGFAYPSHDEYKRICFINPITREYDLLITGNSKIAYGINPDLLFVKSFNFASQGESFPLTYAKLHYLKHNGKIKFKHIILGLDYFSLSWHDINESYFKPYLPTGGPPVFIFDEFELPANERFNYYMSDNFNSKWRIMFETVFKLARGKNPSVIRFRENGQIIQSRPEIHFSEIDRQCVVNPAAYYYFEKILGFVRENNLSAVFVIPPSGKGEHFVHSADPKKEFAVFLDTLGAKYGISGTLDYSDSPLFSHSDFVDAAGHLSESGADKFTAILNADIISLFGERINEP